MHIETIEELVDVLHQSTLTRLEVEGDAWSLQLERAPAHPAPIAPAGHASHAAPCGPAPAAEEPEAVTHDLTTVESPIVGVFHETMPTVMVGQAVRAGEVLGAIEALALRNDVRSPIDGEVMEINVEDGQPVEYGQPLFTLARLGEEE